MTRKDNDRFYIQWATVCWQVRDRETQSAVAWHKSETKAKADARARNAAAGAPRDEPDSEVIAELGARAGWF